MQMLEAGFTAADEFHYLHHDIDGQPYGDLGDLGEMATQDHLDALAARLPEVTLDERPHLEPGTRHFIAACLAPSRERLQVAAPQTTRRATFSAEME
jgi:hypothetical protein